MKFELFFILEPCFSSKKLTDSIIQRFKLDPSIVRFISTPMDKEILLPDSAKESLLVLRGLEAEIKNRIEIINQIDTHINTIMAFIRKNGIDRRQAELYLAVPVRKISIDGIDTASIRSIAVREQAIDNALALKADDDEFVKTTKKTLSLYAKTKVGLLEELRREKLYYSIFNLDQCNLRVNRMADLDTRIKRSEHSLAEIEDVAFKILLSDINIYLGRIEEFKQQFTHDGLNPPMDFNKIKTELEANPRGATIDYEIQYYLAYEASFSQLKSAAVSARQALKTSFDHFEDFRLNFHVKFGKRHSLGDAIRSSQYYKNGALDIQLKDEIELINQIFLMQSHRTLGLGSSYTGYKRKVACPGKTKSNKRKKN